MNEPEPSYAYLLEKNKQRTCQKDIAYCTWDEKGNPIPFCFEYPNDKKCQRNTQPPNILFMGCYDDPTCDGKPMGPPIIRRATPPYAYTIDGKCRPSKDLCYWLTDEIAVPTCAKDASVAKCRDVMDNYLLGCYTDETCGGMKQPQQNVDQTTDETSQDYDYVVDIADADNDDKEQTSNTKRLIITVTVLAIFVFLFASLLFYLYYQKKHHYKKHHHHRSPPRYLMKNRTI